MSNPSEKFTIGVLADTHFGEIECGEPPKWIIEALKGVDFILHAGDIENPGFLNELSKIAPFYAVKGNMDPENPPLPPFRRIRIGTIEIGLTHRLEDVKPVLDTNLKLLVYGHTHTPEVRQEGSLLILNPGSPTRPRSGHPPSIALVDIDGDVLKVRFKFPPNSIEV